MATSSSSSINGVSSGIDTKALIEAIVAQKGTSLTRFKATKALNDTRTTALTALRSSLSGLSLSLAVLQDKFNSRTVTSTDTNNTNVTATASGSAAGNYDLVVHTVATKGRISSALDSEGLATNMAVASPTDSVNSGVFTVGTSASFAIQGTDGEVKTFTLTKETNTLNGMRDAINASGAGVTASVVNMGKGDNRYQLVISAKETGTSSTGGMVTLVDTTNGASGPVVNNLGIGSGSGAVDPLTKILTGGLNSAASGAVARDATFSVNGIELTRGTNLVKDAADGVTFTLKQGNQTGTTTLTVAPDKASATIAMQDFITKYNQLMKDYKTASTSTKNADGSINEAPLASDVTTRAMMATLKTTLLGASAGFSESAAYKTLASIGVSSLADGGLYLNTNTFQTSMASDLTAAQKLFSFTGESDNQVVTFKSAGPKTATGLVDFAITKDDSGVLWGTLTPRGGVAGVPVQVINGALVGTGDYVGLNLGVTAIGTGTLTLSRGAGMAAKDALAADTSTTGGINTILLGIITKNKNLDVQIQTAQARLNKDREALTKKFAQMESTLGAMRASAGSLAGL